MVNALTHLGQIVRDIKNLCKTKTNIFYWTKVYCLDLYEINIIGIHKIFNIYYIYVDN